MSRDTDNLMMRQDVQEAAKTRARQAQERQAVIIQAQSQLRFYQDLAAQPAFKQYIADMQDRKTAAFEAMDKATEAVDLHKTVGEYIGITRAISHCQERIATLSTFLQEQTSEIAVDSEE